MELMEEKIRKFLEENKKKVVKIARPVEWTFSENVQSSIKINEKKATKKFHWFPVISHHIKTNIEEENIYERRSWTHNFFNSDALHDDSLLTLYRYEKFDCVVVFAPSSWTSKCTRHPSRDNFKSWLQSEIKRELLQRFTYECSTLR